MIRSTMDFGVVLFANRRELVDAELAVVFRLMVQMQEPRASDGKCDIAT